MKRAFLGAASGIAVGLALAIRATLRAPVVEPGGLALVSSLPSPFLFSVAITLGAFLGFLAGRRGWEDLLTPFLPCGLTAAIFVPGAFAYAPFLALFAGRFLDLWLLVAIAISLSRVARGLPSIRLSAKSVGLAGLLLYLGAGSLVSRKVGLSGDEPHYLLIAYSLLRDGDLAVQNNYGSEDHRSFYAGKIEPRLAEGTPYPVHGIGVPLLLLPGFAAAGLFGVLVTEALLAAVLMAVVYRACLRLTGSSSSSLFATALFGLTSPALFLSVSAYPELPAALVVALSFARLVDPSSGPSKDFLLALAAGALPFLHVKFVPLAALLLAALAYEAARKRKGSLAWIAAGAGASIAAFLVFTVLTFGSFDPRAAYGRQRVFLGGVPVGIAGLLFDQEYGLLLHAPVYLLGLSGLVTLFRRNAVLGAVSALALLSVAIPGAAHPLWSGGTSPPARFLFPALPLLAIAGAALIEREREIGVGRLSSWLLAGSVCLGLSMLLLPDGPFFLNARDGTGRIWEALSTSWNLADYLPSLVRADSRSLASACVLVVVLILLVAAQVGRVRGPSASFAFAGALLAFWIQDRTGLSRSEDLESRWVLGIMRDLSERRDQRLLALPARERISEGALLSRVSLPLEAHGGDGDPRHWWSRPYSIPAGRFRLTGAPAEGVTLYNGENAFGSGALEFESEVSLGRFRLRSRRVSEPPRLFLAEPGPSRLLALETVALDGLRLHALDDQSYPDPRGFWVREGARARFATEVERPAAEVRVRIANGGAPNVVSLDAAPFHQTLRLAPWEEKEFAIPRGPFSVESERGFRPRNLDPRSRDDRELGAFVAARPAFD